MTVGDLKKLIAPLDDSLRVVHNTGTARVPVYAVEVYTDEEMSPDGKMVPVEMVDIS